MEVAGPCSVVTPTKDRWIFKNGVGVESKGQISLFSDNYPGVPFYEFYL